MSFVFQCKKMPCDTHPHSVFHRRPLCRHVIGFTLDDKVERSDPAIVKSVIILNNCLWEKIPGEVFTCYYTMCHNLADQAIGVNWQREERLLPACHYFRFPSLKCGLGAVPFFSFYESGCLKNIWSVCYGLCKIVTAGMQ